MMYLLKYLLDLILWVITFSIHTYVFVNIYVCIKNDSYSVASKLNIHSFQ